MLTTATGLERSLSEYLKGLSPAEEKYFDDCEYAENLYWAWRMKLEDDITEDDEEEYGYLMNLLEKIVSDVKDKTADVLDVIKFVTDLGDWSLTQEEVDNAY